MTFAAQAVIAIEDTRLLNELRERTDDLSEVAGAADRDFGGAEDHFKSRGQLEPVFQAIFTSAVRICEARQIWRIFSYKNGKDRTAFSDMGNRTTCQFFFINEAATSCAHGPGYRPRTRWSTPKRAIHIADYARRELTISLTLRSRLGGARLVPCRSDAQGRRSCRP